MVLSCMDNMRSMTCQALLFDLDGTLLDSAARLRRLWQAWGDRHGIPLESIVSVMHGRRAAETLRLIAPHLRPEDEIEALETEEISDMHDVHSISGAAELLASLEGRPWAVVTSGSRRVAEARLNYVGLPLPPVLVTGDSVDEGKPAPDSYLLAARLLGVIQADCIVIEDAPVGVEAGKAAGMRVVAIATTHAAGSLQAADAIVPRLAVIELHLNGAGIHLLLPS